MSMSDAEIREALARAERATPGPWHIGATYRCHVWGGGPIGHPKTRHVATVFEETNDSLFVCCARTDVPRLAADLLATRAERDEALISKGVAITERIHAENRRQTAEARCRELEGFLRGLLHASSGTRNENAAALLSRLETRAQVLLSPPPSHTCQIHRATSGASGCGLSPCEEAQVHRDRGESRPKMRCAICGLVEHVGRCASSPPTSPEAAPVEADTAPEAVKCATCGGGEWVLDPPHAPDCDTPVPAGIRHSHRLVWCKCGARGHECPDCGGGA